MPICKSPIWRAWQESSSCLGWAALGDLMSENHSIQRNLGKRRIQRTAYLCRPIGGALGAKLAGAGGGGTIIALTLTKSARCRRFKRRGRGGFSPVPSKG